METIYILYRINFHSEREFSGVFSTKENAQEYADKFSDERWQIEESFMDSP